MSYTRSPKPPCHLGIEAVNRQMAGGSPLTVDKSLDYDAIRMTHLNAIAAARTVHLWWLGTETHAARWRD